MKINPNSLDKWTNNDNKFERFKKKKKLVIPNKPGKDKKSKFNRDNDNIDF